MLIVPSLLSSERLWISFLPSNVLLSSPPPQCVRKLPSEFSNDLSSNSFTALEPCHGVRHHLLTNPGPPYYAKPWRLHPEKLAATKAKFSTMEKAGIIRMSSSSWSSPLHMVKKKDGGPVEIIEG